VFVADTERKRKQNRKKQRENEGGNKVGKKAVPWLRRLVAGHSQRRLGFAPG
jgi:hypothetical protein